MFYLKIRGGFDPLTVVGDFQVLIAVTVCAFFLRVRGSSPLVFSPKMTISFLKSFLKCWTSTVEFVKQAEEEVNLGELCSTA